MEQNIPQENMSSPVQPTPPIMPLMPKQKKQIPTWVGILIIIIFAVVIFGGVFAYQYFFVKLPTVVESPQTQNQTAGWKTYSNTQYGFEFKYPLLVTRREISADVVRLDVTANNFDVSGMITVLVAPKNNPLILKKLEEPKGAIIFNKTDKVNDLDWQKKEIVEAPQNGIGTYGDEMTYYIEKNDLIYSFTCYGCVPPPDGGGVVNKIFPILLSTFKFTTPTSQDFSTLNKDELLHKLFPALTFNNGVAILPNKPVYEGLKLYLKNSVEDYFVNNQQKDLLVTVQLDGMAHAGGLFHSFMALFDVNGNLLTPSSLFGKEDFDIGQGGEAYDLYSDNVQFGGDGGIFEYYDCNGVEYILFVSRGCPNSTCCSDAAKLLRIINGNFDIVQTIDAKFLGAYGTDINSYFGLKMTASAEKIAVGKVPFSSEQGCTETRYRELNWNNKKCVFE
jgi:hypothetical protein